jgi:hypothetical protein
VLQNLLKIIAAHISQAADRFGVSLCKRLIRGVKHGPIWGFAFPDPIKVLHIVVLAGIVLLG